MRRDLGPWVALLIATGTPAMACDIHTRFEDSLSGSSRAFVGTVVGYRLSDTSLARSAPDCTVPYDDPQLSEECVAFWQRVVSIQYDVETSIAGIEADRKYETGVWNPDGCVPRIGERWLTSGWYRDGFSIRLETPPSAAQIEDWRRVIAER